MPKENNNRKRLFLIDGYALLYRAHFAFIRAPLITNDGLHTSALFGFTNQVLNLLKNEEPDYLAAVFDTPEKTFRHKLYKEYKATREKMPEEMRSQLPFLWQILNSMNIATLSKDGFEADDIIGTLAKDAAEQGLDVYIVSGDKDFMQLITDNIFLYVSAGRGMDIKVYDTDGVEKKWGVPPEKIIDLLGLMGDSSDNVPGVRGVGEKSAVKLIKEYGSLEKALDNAERVTNKRVRTGLIDCKEEALLSKELVTIDTNVSLDKGINDLERKAFDLDSLADLFQKLEFSSLFSQIGQIQKLPEFEEFDSPEKDYKTLLTPEELDAFVTTCKKASVVSFDLETTSIDPMRAEIVGLSFSIKPNAGVYIPVRYQDKNKIHFGDDELASILEALRSVFESSEIPKIGQNVKYDSLILKRHGIRVSGIVFDTMIAAHLINPASRSYKLDNLSVEYLNYKMVPIEDLIGSGRNQISMEEVPLDKIAYYAAEDADVALQLTAVFKKKLKENDLNKFFFRVEVPLIEVLWDMEMEGVFVDKDILKTMSDQLGRKLENSAEKIIKEAGTEFNINSTQQLAQILFDKFELPQIRKRSTAEEVLERLRNKHPLPGMILEYRKLNKLKNTYLDTFPNFIHPETARIHSNFSQTVAATGRLSSSSPNFQNIPVRSEIGKEIRKAFQTQKKGWKIISADYSQIELRIMAHLSRDAGLIKAFHNGEDIHSRTASDIYNIPIGDVQPEMRRTAKVVNFAIMYGAGPFRMSQELQIPQSESKKIISAYFEKYSGIRDYIDRTLELAREKGYVMTMLGRKRPVWDADSDNRIRREAAARMAINMPIQGTAAEMIKLAMISIHEKLHADPFQKCKMILQIHDELLFEVPGELVTAVSNMVVSEMENALPLSVPVVVDCGVGESWFEAH